MHRLTKLNIEVPSIQSHKASPGAGGTSSSGPGRPCGVAPGAMVHTRGLPGAPRMQWEPVLGNMSEFLLPSWWAGVHTGHPGRPG